MTVKVGYSRENRQEACSGLLMRESYVIYCTNFHSHPYHDPSFLSFRAHVLPTTWELFRIHAPVVTKSYIFGVLKTPKWVFLWSPQLLRLFKILSVNLNETGCTNLQGSIKILSRGPYGTLISILGTKNPVMPKKKYIVPPNLKMDYQIYHSDQEKQKRK